MTAGDQDRRARVAPWVDKDRTRGVGIFSSVFGLIFFLVFLLFAVQLMYSL